MYTIFLLVALVASSFLETVQFQCCIPSQLETYIDELSFVPGARGRNVVQNTSYDAVTKREAFHVFDNTINNGYDVIYDYRANMSYMWSRGVCNVSYAGPFHEFCFAEGKLVRKSFMGVFPEITKLNTYMVAGKRCHASYTVGKSCSPVELEMNCNDSLTLTRFYNMTLGIKNESVFTPPKICFKKESRRIIAHQTPLFFRTAAMFGTPLEFP
ncbi:uncharacterized protein [Magallana gigas]|uniref:Uncharacterized protein n=1 Tax=Magallana gigas TaxID=29159 RepID=A0A8W8JTT0_MAGGI|nr:uncharacterized protein LOC105342871 [Crassostrea gigas]